ncbi:Ubiquitin-specific protease family C19-related protein, partial [Parasponia andersonii]
RKRQRERERERDGISVSHQLNHCCYHLQPLSLIHLNNNSTTSSSLSSPGLLGSLHVVVLLFCALIRTLMGSRFPSHQLSNGLYVSGRPEQPKERIPTMSSVSMPYIGGDIKKSGELGKMVQLASTEGSKSRKSGPLNSAPSRTGSFGGAASQSGPIAPNTAARGIYTPASVPSGGSASIKKSNSGPLNKHGEPIKKSSGPLSGGVTRQNSGVLPTTGLITSGPVTSGPLNPSGAPRKVSGPLEYSLSMKVHGPSVIHNQAVTTLSQEDEFSFRRNFPKPVLWSVILLFVMGFIAGGFILGAVHNAILLIVVVILFSLVVALFTWNTCWRRRAVINFISSYPDAELRKAKDGQLVKVSGVVTCGHVPLESSFGKVSRCVYTSTSLYEYRGWDSKPANPTHRRFTWGLRSSERHVVDFYISDFQSGLRALVKTGYGARVIPYVDDSFVVDVNPSNEHLSPEFVKWLRERNLSSDDRTMRLKEGYIKEGSTVSVLGVVQRNDNVLMIVPPLEPLSTGCQYMQCIFPSSLEGIVLRCEDSSKNDVIAV